MSLTDQSPMPFGKYAKGGKTAMEDVPAGYLLWLWNNGLCHLRLPSNATKGEQDRMDVRNYIIENMAALSADAPDVIVNKDTAG